MTPYFSLQRLPYLATLILLIFFSPNYGQIAVESSDNKVGIGHLSPVYDVHVKADIFNIESKSGARRLYLNEAGQLGLGTNTPSVKFEIFSYGNTFAKMKSVYPGGRCGLQIDNNGLNSQGRIFFSRSGITTGGIFYNHNSGGLSQDMSFDVAGSQPELIIKGNGKIGIGTLTPNARLEVNGSVRITGLPTDNSAIQLGIDPEGDLVKMDVAFAKSNEEHQQKFERLQNQLTDQKKLIDELWNENDYLKEQLISYESFEKIQANQNRIETELAETHKKYDDLLSKVELMLRCVDCSQSYGSSIQNKENTKRLFNLYPNPAQGELTIRSSQNIDLRLHLIISDNFGRRVVSKPLKEQISTIDISELVSGLYHVTFLHNDEIIEHSTVMIVN